MFVTNDLMEYRWTASDTSGICRYSIDEDSHQRGVDLAERLTTSPTKRSGNFSFDVDSWENSDDLGRNSHQRLRLRRQQNIRRAAQQLARMKDRHWARRSLVAGGKPFARARWVTAPCGRARRTRPLSTVVNSSGYSIRVGLTMATGPVAGQGRDLLRRGATSRRSTVTHPTNRNRVVTWEVEVTGSSNHTIKVVNLATIRPPADRHRRSTSAGRWRSCSQISS